MHPRHRDRMKKITRAALPAVRAAAGKPMPKDTKRRAAEGKKRHKAAAAAATRALAAEECPVVLVAWIRSISEVIQVVYTSLRDLGIVGPNGAITSGE